MGEIEKYEHLEEIEYFEEKYGSETEVTGKKEDLELSLRELKRSLIEILACWPSDLF